MSILEYNGGAVVAMRGRGCVCVAADTRFGVQLQTLASDFPRVFRIHDRLLLGLAGLATDVQTLKARLQFRHKLFELREERVMGPRTFGNLLATMLYERRFGPYFASPIVAGLEADGTPYICTMDLIGAMEESREGFEVAGTAEDSLYGACESFYRPDLGPEELFEVISQALLASVDRDSMSGWGAQVHIMTEEGITTKTIRCRCD